MPIDIGGALGGIGSFFGNQISSAINSSRAWKYTQRAMQLQDQLNRNYTRDSYGIMREGLEKAGYNPLLALGSGANQAVYSGSGINADSDAGDQAVNSAINAMQVKANVDNVKQNTEKIKTEKKGLELDNRLKLKELNTNPKAVISDLLEGNDTPVTKVLKKLGSKIGVSTGEINSAVSSGNKSTPIVIRLHDNKPYVQRGVPRSVVNSFDNIIKDKNSALSVLDKLPKHYKFDYIKHSEGKKYKYYDNKPPKNFPSGM